MPEVPATTTTAPVSSAPTADSRTAVGGIVVVAALWATSGPASAIATAGSSLSPIQVSFWRAVAAAVALVVIAAALVPARRRRAARDAGYATRAAGWRQPRHLLTCATVGVLTAVLITLYIAAVDSVGIALATLLQLGTAPLVVVFVGSVFLGRPADRLTLAALGLAVGGLLLLVGADVRGGGSVVGALMAVLSGTGLATVFLVSGPLSSRVPPLDVNVVATVVGAVFMLVVALPGGLTSAATGVAVGAVVYLGVVASALAYGVYYLSAGHVRASTVAVVGLLEPLLAALLAAAFFGESLGVVQLVGGALLLLAIGLLNARADG